MMNIHKNILKLSLIFFIVLTGCTAVGIPIIINPQDKLSWAQRLIEIDQRPFPAEKLIVEAVERYKQDKDEVGLALSYRMYALLLQSEAVTNWGNYKSFFDKTVNYQNRYQKSLEYWQRSLGLLEKNETYDKVSNIYYHIAVLNSFFNDKDLACKNFAKSIEVHEKFLKMHPGIKIDLPAGYKTFKEFIEKEMKDSGCVSEEKKVPGTKKGQVEIE